MSRSTVAFPRCRDCGHELVLLGAGPGYRCPNPACGIPQHDPVTAPSHYTQGSIECIDAIEAALGRDGFIAFLRGQVIKYSWRLGLKGPALEDAQKAFWYQDRLTVVLQRAC